MISTARMKWVPVSRLLNALTYKRRLVSPLQGFSSSVAQTQGPLRGLVFESLAPGTENTSAYLRNTVLVAATLLCIGFGSSALGAVRFDIVGSPTEVINTGRSEVLGSINLIVRNGNNVTGTSTGGASQIAVLLSSPAVQIDNTTSTGIKLIYTPGFAAASPSILSVDNVLVNGRCSGLITLNVGGGVAVSDGDYIRLEGMRGRIDASAAVTPGTDIYADLQSINDPAANTFTPDRLRLAKSLKGMNVEIATTSQSYAIRITEGFGRAFVDADAGNDASTANDRTDSNAAALGAPTNSTQFVLRTTGIPSGIEDVIWPAKSTTSEAGAALYLLSSSFDDSVSTATYSYEAVNQPNVSDTVTESFSITPQLVLREGGSCRLEGFTTSVTLAPAVKAAESCAAPSDEARPRFLEAYELSVTGLQPVSAVAGGSDFTLTVNGTGFVQGSTVLWNDVPRATTFVSGTTVTAAITAADIARVGTARVSVANPITGMGAASQPRSFQIVAPAMSLYYPRLVATDTAVSEATEYTGIALANISGRVATVKLTALDRNGTKITGSDITNPVTLTLTGGEQRPLIDSQIFGAGLRKAGPVGWVKVVGDVPQVIGFFLTFNGTMTRLDGTDVSAATSDSFVLTEIAGKGSSNLHIANPNDDPVTVNLELVQADGSVRSAVSRTINPNGVLTESVSDLFAGTAGENTDFIRAHASKGVVAFEYLGTGAGDIKAANGQDIASGATTLYSPQFVTGSLLSQSWQSALSVVNLSATAGNISLRFIGDDGVQIGSDRQLPIAANGKIYIDDPNFFVDPGDTARQGYVVIRSDGVKLAGSVTFGTRAGASSALPLLSSTQSGFVFGQVAMNRTFFTGIALLNPGEESAVATMRVFNSSGQAIVSRVVTVPAKGKTSQVVTEYFPELRGLELDSGYITISTQQGYLMGFALFGANNLSVLSAIPAQLVP